MGVGNSVRMGTPEEVGAWSRSKMAWTRGHSGGGEKGANLSDT